MNPDARRGGDRTRRRNTVLATVGGVAAVAVLIGTPVAIVAARDGGDDAQPVTPSGTTEGTSTSVAWVHEIPEGFPLTDGMPEQNGDGSAVLAGQEFAAAASFCPKSHLWPPRNQLDWLGATYLGESEDSETRSIHVFADASAAAALLDTIRAEFEECPRFDLDDGSAFVTYQVKLDLAADESLAYATQVEETDGTISGLEVVEDARTGNAVYVVRSGGSAGGDSVIDYEADRLRKNSATVLESMCVFSAEPCSTSSTSTKPTEPAEPAPEPPSASSPPPSDALTDFPLDLGLEETNGTDGSPVEVAGRPGVGVLEMCGATAWDPHAGTADVLGVEQSDVEHYRGRTLVTYPSDSAAADVLDSAAAALEACPEDASQAESGGVDVNERFDVELGDQSLVWTQRYRPPGRDTFSLGVETIHMVRVGNAVYVAYEASEGDPADDAGAATFLRQPKRPVQSWRRWAGSSCWALAASVG